MLKIFHSPQKTYPRVKKIPQRTIYISTKNGKSEIKAEFIGYYAKRVNPIEFIMDLADRLYSLLHS